METRAKTTKLMLTALALLILTLTFTPTIVEAQSRFPALAGVTYQSRVGGGYISFTFNQQVSAIVFASDFVNFHQSHRDYPIIGYDTPTDCNVTVTTITEKHIKFTTTQTVGAKTVRLYLPSQETPTVTGAASYSWNSGTNILTINTTTNSTVTVQWQVIDRVMPILVLGMILLALTPIILAAIYLVALLSGNAGPEQIQALLQTIIFCLVGLVIIMILIATS